MRAIFFIILFLIKITNAYCQGSVTNSEKDTARTANQSDTIINLKAGTVLIFENIYFEKDRHKIMPESQVALDKLYTILITNPNLKIGIEGHVCCITKAEDALDIDTYQPKLSVTRAKAVYDYLVKKGINKHRLQYAGFGKSRPVIAEEKTEEDAAKNKRVEIRIIEN